ncbi:MAG: BatA domain-containing protein [Pirellulales bacterium]|nr:BatA domain-containing protein [Pirellulales bacterium]
MSFLQPLLLVALPLVSLPIIIHLINQRRYQTIRWGAMMFLLAANRMSRGYARIRQWLILLIRTLAVAGLIFAVSRPLASGWLGFAAGGKPDTTILIVDRSPSMQQLLGGSAASKLQTGLQQLVETVSIIGSDHWVLIDSATGAPIEVESPQAVLKLPSVSAVAASSDVPALLQAAYDYIQRNKSGRTDIWICSDLRANDWNAEGGRWQSLRDAFREIQPGVRFTLHDYSQPSPGNLSIRVTDVRRQSSSTGAELLISLRIVREGGGTDKITLPLHFEIDQARSETEIELTGDAFELKDHPIPLAKDQQRGWGRVSIPADANPADNEFYFLYDKPQPRRTVIVADDPQAVRPLQLAAAVSPHPSIECATEMLSRDQLASVEWDRTALLLWQTALPSGAEAKLVEQYIARGGQVIFFPPQSTTQVEFQGVQWKPWTADERDLQIDHWRGDQGLLARTQSGAALPVGELAVHRHCGMAGEVTNLASLAGGAPLLARVHTARGGVYFCATTVDSKDSTLASNGVVLYAAIQRALDAGAAVLGNLRQLVAGAPPPDVPGAWTQIAGGDAAISTEYSYQPGIYSAGDRMLAVNRPVSEDGAAIVPEVRCDQLFNGLPLTRIKGEAGSTHSLMQEIWRLFLTTMMVALVVEAGLCLPKRSRQPVAGPGGLI